MRRAGAERFRIVSCHLRDHRRYAELSPAAVPRGDLVPRGATSLGMPSASREATKGGPSGPSVRPGGPAVGARGHLDRGCWETPVGVGARGDLVASCGITEAALGSPRPFAREATSYLVAAQVWVRLPRLVG
jgi:hypothetical protein